MTQDKITVDREKLHRLLVDVQNALAELKELKAAIKE